MRQSWLSVVNLVILITASVVVNMHGSTSPNSGPQTTSGSPSTQRGAETTHRSPVDASGTSQASPGDVTEGDDSAVTTDSSLNTGVSTGVSLVNLTSNDTRMNDSDQDTRPPKPALRSFVEFQMYLFLLDGVEWVNAFPGMILNPLCVYVTMIMKPFNSTSLFMVTLAITDFIIVFVRFVYRQVEDGQIFTHRECCLFWGLINAMLTYSNFILIVWTIERMIAVRFPLKVISWCSMRNTKIALGVALCIASLISIPYYIHLKGNVFGGCDFGEFLTQYWYYVDNAYYVWIPMTCIVVSNTIILYSIRKTRKAHAAMTQNTESIEKREREQRKLSLILGVICISFIIFHIPQIVLAVITEKYPDPLVIYDDRHAFAQLIAYTRLGYEFTFLQNNINFLLYCSTGQKFRQTFLKVVCFWRSKRRAMDYTNTDNTGVSVISKSA